MEKPAQDNGFTMLESLMILLIVCILMAVMTLPGKRVSLSLFMDQLRMQTLSVQEQAFASKERKYVSFYEGYALFDGETLVYPSGITCEPFSIHFNASGNISTAGTLRCQASGSQARLVFQLGSGRVRYEAQ